MSRPRRFDWLFRPQLADADLPLSAEARFAEAMAQLPAVERSALALSEIGGLDVNEIAERLGTDPAVVGKLLARARNSVRTSLSARGRRGLAAVLPFQNWWQTGSAAPVVRAAGIVAAAVVGPSVVIGGAAADGPPRASKASTDTQIRAVEPAAPHELAVRRPSVPVSVAAVVAKLPQMVSAAERPPVSPGAGRDRDRDAATTSPLGPLMPEPAAPAAEPTAPPAAAPETAVETVPLLAAVESAPTPVDVPLEPPPVPVDVLLAPELPPLPPLPPLGPVPLP